MRNDLKKTLGSNLNQQAVQDYQRLISFLDAAMSQAFALSGDERAKFLVSNMLNMRDFLSSAIVTHQLLESLQHTAVGLFDRFVEDGELDMASIEATILEKNKKKEEELKASMTEAENSLETDPKMSLEKDRKE